MSINTALILAAGYGKRMMPLTSKIPKPMIEIYNKPLLGHAIETLLSIGIKNIVVNTHYKSKIIHNYLKSNFGLSNIKISYEPKLLDTAGALKNAKKYLNEDIILTINSDIFWSSKNERDLINLKKNILSKNFKCRLLLSKIKNTYGIKKTKGDFYLKKNKLKRNKKNHKGFFYTGAQIININILNHFDKKIFSFNEVWDSLIIENKMENLIMKSKILHLGDFEGLNYINSFKP